MAQEVIDFTKVTMPCPVCDAEGLFANGNVCPGCIGAKLLTAEQVHGIAVTLMGFRVMFLETLEMVRFPGSGESLADEEAGRAYAKGLVHLARYAGISVVPIPMSPGGDA